MSQRTHSILDLGFAFPLSAIPPAFYFKATCYGQGGSLQGSFNFWRLRKFLPPIQLVPRVMKLTAKLIKWDSFPEKLIGL